MIKISVDNINKKFPKYPITIEDKGWVYGVWYCGTGWTKVKLYGQYPPTFLKRAKALFVNVDKILHCPSGTIEEDITVDIIRDEIRKPMYVASADNLPFEDDSFDLVLSDPPYTGEDFKKYNTEYVPFNKMMREFRRVLKPGGYLGVLHIWYPSYRRKDWGLVGLIAVVTGFQRQTRMFSIFQKKGDNGFKIKKLSDYRTKEED